MSTLDLISAYTAQRTPLRPRRPGLFRRLVRHIHYMRQYDRLLNQPDHILRDIGLTRADIRARRRWSTV